MALPHPPRRPGRTCASPAKSEVIMELPPAPSGMGRRHLGPAPSASSRPQRGESISALWLVKVAAVCIISSLPLLLASSSPEGGLDRFRMTPPMRYSDGLDYVPPTKRAVSAHHFCRHCPASRLVGGAHAQMGYHRGHAVDPRQGGVCRALRTFHDPCSSPPGATTLHGPT